MFNIMKLKELKIKEIIDREESIIKYEVNKLFEMVESHPEDIEANLKFAKGVYRRFGFLCTIKNREGLYKNAE